MIFPYYIFGAALLIFLLYNYRQVIKEKLGYHDNEMIFTQSVENLQLELRGTADAIIEQFARENQRLEIILAKAAERIAELENLLATAEGVRQPEAKQSHFSSEKEKLPQEKTPGLSSEAAALRQVRQLAAQGMDVHAIGTATGLSYSKVRLLLKIGNQGAD